MAKSRIDEVAHLVWQMDLKISHHKAAAAHHREIGNIEQAELCEAIAAEEEQRLKGAYQVIDILGWTEKVNERI